MSSPSLEATTNPGSESQLPTVAAPHDARLRVVFSIDPEAIGRSASLDGSLVRVGREPQAEGLSLADARLSRVHARAGFDPRSGAMRIGDAHSRNGTFVNGRRIETAVLAHGDVIRAGDTLLIYEEHDAFARLTAEASAAAPLAATVLIRGETGTGKELLARELHAASGRSGPFVALNCASVPLELLSAELFGHTKAAFSGAGQARKGVFSEAASGTLLLDEIGDCPLPVQAALLRALQEKAVRPVGAEREQPVDVRVIAATHRDLEQMIGTGAFRADLFARIAQVSLEVPALRERRTEIVPLLESFAREQGYECTLSADAAEALLLWHWPLNVRELQALVHAAAVRGFLPGKVGLEQLRDAAPKLAALLLGRRAGASQALASSPPPSRPSLHDHVRARLEAHEGNVSAVAQELGKPRAQVYRWLRSMGVSPNRFRR